MTSGFVRSPVAEEPNSWIPLGEVDAIPFSRRAQKENRVEDFKGRSDSGFYFDQTAASGGGLPSRAAGESLAIWRRQDVTFERYGAV